MYDYIIAGAGCAGLSLVFHLLKSDELKNKRILILDRDPKNARDKTWCFWGREPLEYSCAHEVAWDKLVFQGPQKSSSQNITPYTYYHINSLEFYREILSMIEALPNVDVKWEKVLWIEDGKEAGRVNTVRNTYEGKWIFNSINFSPRVEEENTIQVLQHFKGWFIETQEEVFHPGQATLMDFQLSSPDEISFFYILPFSTRKALIEYTVFSNDLLAEEEYETELKRYIQEVLGTSEYTITHQENGVIPMTNREYSHIGGKRIVNLGMIGGDTKPSTGYTFFNIQKSVKSIVSSLVVAGHPFERPSRQSRFLFYDTLLLDIMNNDPHAIRAIFEGLFARNKMIKVLRFLDEETSLWDEAWLFLRLPWKYFFKALFRNYFPRRVKKAELSLKPL
ncbi:MAG: lycopene cyclase [Bacteroidetes bacterium]|nr:lycopene cyclase [Bacteroidota bacterium]